MNTASLPPEQSSPDMGRRAFAVAIGLSWLALSAVCAGAFLVSYITRIWAQKCLALSWMSAWLFNYHFLFLIVPVLWAVLAIALVKLGWRRTDKCAVYLASVLAASSVISIVTAMGCWFAALGPLW